MHALPPLRFTVQELPENLKALFRGVTMMVPDREIIMKVKLCAVGYTSFNALARKFFVCYQLAEQQLSKQKHYDFGLRNILSVLRTAGATKRDNIGADEEMLLYRTLRDMNLSKLVAQDVPLFLSMLADLFPVHAPPPKREYPKIEAAIRTAVMDAKLVYHPSWINKVIQLHETCLVRHGVMLTGPAGAGKSRIMEVLHTALAAVDGRPIKIVRLNPKAVLAHELYGQTDPQSGEWVKGIFASLWEKFNNRDLPYTTWLVMDGPVDAIWIEDLNVRMCRATLWNIDCVHHCFMHISFTFLPAHIADRTRCVVVMSYECAQNNSWVKLLSAQLLPTHTR